MMSGVRSYLTQEDCAIAIEGEQNEIKMKSSSKLSIVCIVLDAMPSPDHQNRVAFVGEIRGYL